MKIRTLGLGACAAILLFASTPSTATPLTYNISTTVQAVTITGRITTDGALGPLAAKNILDWSVTLTLNGKPYTFSKSSGGTLSISGRDLTASTWSISFNFADTNAATAGQFAFSDNKSSPTVFGGISELACSFCGGAGSLYAYFDNAGFFWVYPASPESIAFRSFIRPWPWPWPYPWPYLSGSERFYHFCHRHGRRRVCSVGASDGRAPAPPLAAQQSR